MTDSTSKLVLLDNTVLSNFALVKHTDLVRKFWDNCSTTEDAWQEYQSGVALGYLPKGGWKTLPRIQLTGIEVGIAQQFMNVLGPGERICIAVSKNRDGIFVTDDRKARSVAQKMGVIVTGTVGILVVAVERDIISINEANQLLNEMIRNGYRSPLDDLNGLLT